MNFKRIFLVLTASLMLAGIASAQQSKADKTVEFNPHWYVQLQGGAAYTLGETADFTKLLSPSAFLNVGYNFTPVTGVRVGLGGWQGKGYHVYEQTDYSFKFGQAYADLMFNLCNLFGGYNHKRLVSVVPFFGVGGYLGFENSQAGKLISYANEKMTLLWEPVTPFFAARAGALVDFRICDNFSINLEGNVNGIDDRFNSKDGDNIDWQFNALLGLTYRFGSTRPSKATAEELALADALAAAAAAQKAAQLAKDNAAKEIADAQKAADDRAAKAEADFDAAIKLAPDNAYLYFDRGNLRCSVKNYSHAIDDYTKAISLNPDIAEVYFNRGLAYLKLGNKQQAVADLSKAGELGLYDAYSIIKQQQK